MISEARPAARSSAGLDVVCGGGVCVGFDVGQRAGTTAAGRHIGVGFGVTSAGLAVKSKAIASGA